MRRSRASRREAIVELTPLIDVVFLLLIFFMVSTSFRMETQLSVELPSAEATAKKVIDSMVISISRDRRYAIDDEVLLKNDAAAVELSIRQAIKASNPEQIVLVADAQTPHQSVVTVLDVLSRADVKNVQIQTQSLRTKESQNP